MTPATGAAADAPIRWPLAVVPNNRAPQRLSRHAWPSVDGLAVALGRKTVDTAAGPSVLAPSCDASRKDGTVTAAMITRPSRQDGRRTYASRRPLSIATLLTV